MSHPETQVGTALNQPVRGNVTRGMERILDKPRCSLYRVGAISPAAATPYTVAWDTIDYQSEGMWSAAAPTRITCITAGLYKITGWGEWAADNTFTRRLLIQRIRAGVATSYPANGHETNAVGAGLSTTHGPLSYDIDLQAGDYLEMYVTQFTAGALAWLAASAVLRSNGFQACLISTTN